MCRLDRQGTYHSKSCKLRTISISGFVCCVTAIYKARYFSTDQERSIHRSEVFVLHKLHCSWGSGIHEEHVVQLQHLSTKAQRCCIITWFMNVYEESNGKHTQCTLSGQSLWATLESVGCSVHQSDWLSPSAKHLLKIRFQEIRGSCHQARPTSERTSARHVEPLHEMASVCTAHLHIAN